MICVIIVQNSSITHSHSFYISPLLSFVIYRPLPKAAFQTLIISLSLFSDSFLLWYLMVVAPVHYFLTEKMHVSPSNFKGPWPPKLRLRVRPEPRYNHIYSVLKELAVKFFFFGSLGYSCRRWTEGFAGSTGSLRGHRRILVRSAIEIPSGKSWTSQCCHKVVSFWLIFLFITDP